MNAYTRRMYERGEDSPRRGYSIDEGVEAGISPTSAGTSGVIPAQRSQGGLLGALNALECGLFHMSSRKPDDI